MKNKCNKCLYEWKGYNGYAIKKTDEIKTKEWKLIINSKEMEFSCLADAYAEIDEVLNEIGSNYFEIEDDIIQNPENGGCSYNGKINFEIIDLR